MKELEAEFVKAFSQTLSKVMFGDGSDPLVMPTNKNVNAQKHFTRVLNRDSELKTYAQNLNTYLTDVQDSSTATKQSMVDLITAELSGKLSPHRGFATDIIPVSPFRKIILLPMGSLLSMAAAADQFKRSTFINVRFDYESIEHINESFAKQVESFSHFMSYYEKEMVEKQPKKPFTIDPSMSAEDNAFIQRMDAEIGAQATIFLKHYQLENLECHEQTCRLFLPLITAMFDDQNTRRTLNNVDKDVLKSLNDNLATYRRLQQKFYLEVACCERERKAVATYFKDKMKPPVARIEAAPAPKMIMAAAPSVEPKKDETKKPVAQPAAKAKTTKRKVGGKTEKKVSATAPSSTPSSQHEKEKDPLTTWLLDPKRSQGHYENCKNEYREPSGLDVRDERKRLAKEEKRKNAAATPAAAEEPKVVSAEAPKAVPVFRITGGYDVFKAIMDEKYDGEMDQIELLIKNRFNGMAYLSHGRWHFAVPHIAKNNASVFASTLEPMVEEEADSNVPDRAVTTVHNPHKFGSKRLRPYHVEALKELFERAGYNLETVKEVRD
jgi:hypothetical protein